VPQDPLQNPIWYLVYVPLSLLWAETDSQTFLLFGDHDSLEPARCPTMHSQSDMHVSVTS
jgi:hypothetical protein